MVFDIDIHLHQFDATMAKETRAQAAATLRALTYRISSSPAKQLPHIAPQIAASLWNCRSILSAPGDAVKANSETTQAVNRFRSTIAQLLQARSVEERWAGVVFAKATVEAGGREIVSKATGWTKNLIVILKKNDPSTTKVLATITLTRIFRLTWEDSNLVREITTPVLPGFVQACLAAVDQSLASANVLQTVLQAFGTLLPRHPTIFRTFESQIRTLLLRILSTTASADASDNYFTADHHKTAQRLFALLHHCAPKQGGAEKWSDTVGAIVTAAHATCDRIFRSVNEGWKSTAGVVKTKSVSNGELCMDGFDALGLPAWRGLYPGAERVITLIQTLEAHIFCTTSNTTSIRLGLLVDLLNRLLSLDASVRNESPSFNTEISKGEREALFSTLPAIHAASLDLLRNFLERFGHVIVSTMPYMVETLSGPFAAELSHVEMRTATYRLLETALGLIGSSLTKDSIAELSLILRTCCEDLLPSIKDRDQMLADSQSQISHRQPATNGTSSTEKSSHALRNPTLFTDLETAAAALLPLFFSKLDQSHMHSSLRAKLEQTAVMTRNKDALVACVLNPPKRSRSSGVKPSLLPLLAREIPHCAEVEALLRPRMPIVGSGTGGKGALNVHVEDRDMQEDESESENEEGEDEGDEDADEGAVNGQIVDDDVAEEEVFSTAPEQTPAEIETLQSNKRPAESHEEASAKRLRASPVAALDPASSVAVPEVADVFVTAVVDGTDGSQAATLPGSEVELKATGAGDDDDESDFEIPPLTMESDSEVEE